MAVSVACVSIVTNNVGLGGTLDSIKFNHLIPLDSFYCMIVLVVGEVNFLATIMR